MTNRSEKKQAKDHTLTIKGHTEHEEEEKRDDYYRMSSSTGMRAAVDDTKVEAVLDIRPPKLEPAKQREIVIKPH